MALTPCTITKGVIGDLGTTVTERGLTTQQFKDKFDAEPDAIIDFINALIAELDIALAAKETADAAIMKTDEAETMTAVLTAKNGTDYTTKQVRNIRFKTSDHTTDDLSNGEIGFVYS